MIITFATTFFKSFFFEAALSVNLTTMLIVTTISIGKMQTLPTTAYIRMIDVWLVFCQLVPFAEVILLTAQEVKIPQLKLRLVRFLWEWRRRRLNQELLFCKQQKMSYSLKKWCCRCWWSKFWILIRQKATAAQNFRCLELFWQNHPLIFQYIREKDSANECGLVLVGVFWHSFSILTGLKSINKFLSKCF